MCGNLSREHELGLVLHSAALESLRQLRSWTLIGGQLSPYDAGHWREGVTSTRSLSDSTEGEIDPKRHKCS